MLKKLQWLLLGMIAIALVLLGHPLAQARVPLHYTELSFSPLSDLELPAFERYQLDNGLVVYLMEDHRVPLINGSLVVHTGTRLEPAEKVGVAELLGIIWRTGGTEYHSPAEVNQMIENQGAMIETQVNNTMATASFNGLSQDIEPLFKLFAEIIRFPRFDAEQFQLGKIQLTGEIARRNDDPKDIASREFRQLIYGDTSPYSRSVTTATLDQIDREDILNFYKGYFRPDQMILGIVGDFEPEAMKVLIAETLGDWQVSTASLEVSVPSVTSLANPGVFFVNQPQLTQSHVVLGHLGGKFDSPDYPALSVVNGLLNGFGGRLYKEVRSRQGLAYSVYGLWSPQYDYPGVFAAGGQTSSETTVPFVQSILEEIEQLRTNPINETELAYAKESILNSFIFNFEKPGQSLWRLMLYEYYGYSPDFIFEYQKQVKKTTIEDVKRVSETYLKPSQIVILVVGNQEGIEPPLTTFDSEIKTVDISS